VNSLNQALNCLMNFTIKEQFVSFYETEEGKKQSSLPHHKKNPSLNWIVTLNYNGKKLFKTTYMAGHGHCLSKDIDAIWDECLGYRVTKAFNKADFLNCIILETDVLNHDSFESWAQELGYDTDSLKAKKIYDTCRKQAEKLLKAIGEDNLQSLREAFQDY